MSASDVLIIIKEIPNYVQYFYPGYLTIYIFSFFRGYTLKENKGLIVKAIGISYIYVVFLTYLVKPNTIPFNFCLIIISFVMAYCSNRIIHIDCIFKYIGDTTTSFNEIEEILAGRKQAWLRIYLKNKNIVYEGSLGHYEMEQDKNKFIILCGFIEYCIDGCNESVIKDYRFKNNEKIVIYYNDIDRIEVNDVDRILEEYNQ